jgi:hypothetical protein
VTVSSCAATLSSYSANPLAAASTTDYRVTVTSACGAWTATKDANASWLTIWSGASGTGNGTVVYSVAENTTTSSRVGTLTIAGNTYTVTQAAAVACTATLSSYAVIVGAAASTTDNSVDVISACGAWTATKDANAAWITIKSGASGTGNGTVVYSVAENTNTVLRIGTLTIAGSEYKVTQAAGAPVTAPVCTLSASPAAITAGASTTLTAVCTGATSHTWTGGSCAGKTTATCTDNPTATTNYTVTGSNAGGTGAAASLSLSVVPAPTVGKYDGIYIWSEGKYLSLHQDGSAMIATIYFNVDAGVSFSPTSGGTLPVAQLDTYDVLNGTITDKTATIEGPRAYGACVASYQLTFGDNGKLTATRVKESATTTSLVSIDCATILGVEKDVAMNRISFGVPASPPVATTVPFDGIYQWSPDNFLSIHQDGADFIVTNYFNETFGIPINLPTIPPSALRWIVTRLGSFDLIGGKLEGNVAKINATTNTKYHRVCNVTYDFTLNADGSQLTVTRTSVSNTKAADDAKISCQKIVEAESTGATFTIPRLRFYVAPPN